MGHSVEFQLQQLFLILALLLYAVFCFHLQSKRNPVVLFIFPLFCGWLTSQMISWLLRFTLGLESGASSFAFFAGLIAGNYFILRVSTINSYDWAQHQDRLALFLCGFYVLLRLGCFFNGCCWGALSDLPWAMRYSDPRSLMPILAVPVHPYPLYAILHGAFMFVSLLLLKRLSLEIGLHLYFFLAAFGLGRMITDSFRFEAMQDQWPLLFRLNFIWAMAFSAIGITLFLRRFSRAQRFFPICLFFLFSCVPSEPKLKPEDSWLEGEILGYQTKNFSAEKNLLLIIDNGIAVESLDRWIKKKFPKRSSLQLEDLIWWRYWPIVSKNYEYVVRIEKNALSKTSLLAAFRLMESFGKNYDALLLVHGLPNHLKASKGKGLISWQDLEELRGELRFADLLYLQSCRGSSLAGEWLEAGVRNFVAYDAYTDNMFFPELLLNEMQRNSDVESAFKAVSVKFRKKIQRSIYYSQAVSRIFQSPVSDYLDRVAMPIHFQP